MTGTQPETPRRALGEHPNSIAAQAWNNPALARRIEEGRRRDNEDRQSLDDWAKNGFQAAIQPEFEDYGAGE